MKRWILRLTMAMAALAFAAFTTTAFAQVTTGSIRGLVTDNENSPLQGARIVAVHLPSGTQYVGASRADGRFNIPGMRVGGPYSVTATMIGFARQNRDDIQVTLGVSSDLIFKMDAVATQLSAVTVTSEGGELSSTRTGAATTVRREALEQLPTVSRRLSDFTRLTPQASGNSFAGQDNRLNNITIDGAAFNNSFGLGGQPGERTGVAPISLDAIEAVQVNIAPFDVRQGGFVGAAVNTVTRSGDNELRGSLYYNVRDQDYVGRNAGRRVFNPGTFSFDQIGFRLGGPILKDKLFFFVSYESDENEAPANTNLVRETATTATGGNITRVVRADMENVRDTLQTLFGYNPGEYEGYPGLTPSSRITARADYAMSERNKLSFRYSQLRSETDVLMSTSSSLGFGRVRNQSMGYSGSNYTILENIDNYAAEWNSLISDRMSNQLVFTYTKQDESRGAIGNLFPFVDILDGGLPGAGGTTYISFGSEPFTPNNELRYSNWQLQNNFTIYGNRHDLTLGVNVEGYESMNVFFPGKQSSYVYNSLADFYADARAFVTACGTTQAAQLACTSHTASPAGAGPRRFQVRSANVQGMVKPEQPLEVNFMGAYVQDEWRVGSGLTVTGGVRVDVVSFGNTAERNAQVDGYRFRDETGDTTVQYSTSRLPDATPLVSPRLGFNYDMRGNGRTIVRGGTGIFTGRPAYVWISNQIGNNGVLTGFEQADAATGAGTDSSITNRPFSPNPDRYKPAESSLTNPATPAPTYELALTDKNFKFPQVWRSNLAIDHRFENGWLTTVEFLWGRHVTGVYYSNANLPKADSAFPGIDARPRWVSDKCSLTAGDTAISGVQTNRINCKVTSAVVMKNQNVGRTYNAAISLERAFRNGFFTKFATAYGSATNTVDAGSIAFGSWNNNQHTGDPNNPAIGNASGYQGRRSIAATSYTRDWFGWGNTTVSAFLENFTTGQRSYTFGGDLNGDGGTSNDLIYVPRNASEMNFAAQSLTSGTFNGVACSSGSPCAISIAMQESAWDAYINQDPHLRTRRGQYALRSGLVLPNVTRMDVSVSQDLSRMFAATKNTLQVRLDILNFTNMINSDWGLSQETVNAQPLIPTAPTTSGTKVNQVRYTMRVVNGQLMNTTFQKNAGTNDVWRMQLGLRYTFN